MTLFNLAHAQLLLHAEAMGVRYLDDAVGIGEVVGIDLSGGVESRHAEAPDKSGDPPAKNDLRSSALVRSNNASGSSAPPAQICSCLRPGCGFNTSEGE